MSDKQDLATRASTDVQRKEAGGEVAKRRETEILLRPPVDVFEDADGITLHLDMPGVAKERLTIQADKSTLTIEGDVEIPMPQGMEALYAEVHSTHYRRSFTLSGELEADRTEANLKDGVLTVRVPKRAELRPRRIEVKVV
jgi:HSP20 family molecular chaperone IbpA